MQETALIKQKTSKNGIMTKDKVNVQISKKILKQATQHTHKMQATHTHTHTHSTHTAHQYQSVLQT